MLPIIQSLWIGDDLTQIEKLCIRSFLDHGHEFYFYTYTEIGGIPEGTTIRDGNEILDSSNIFQSKSGSYAHFADWFRYAMLVKNGGFWVDMDVICIKPFDFDSDIILVGGSDAYTNAIIGMPAGHPMMVALEKTCRNYQNKARASWGAIGGPRVLSRFINQFEMEQYARPFMYFFPYPFGDWHCAFTVPFAGGGGGGGVYPNTYAVHLYNEMGRKIKLDKNAQFDSETLLEQLKAKHHVVPIENAKHITSTDLRNALLQRTLDKKSPRRSAKNTSMHWQSSLP